MKYLIGLDVGTSAVKALLLTGEGQVVGSHTVEYPLYSPHPGWSEQNPEDMWQASAEAVRGVLGKFQVAPEDVAGLGLSGQMHSSVFLDDNYQVIRPAILWNDVRTTAQCRRIEATVDAEVLREEVCNPVLEGFTLPKVVWLKENEPENYVKLRWLVLPKDYVRFRLTGQLAMEVSDAAGMLMMNVRQRVWSKPVLNRWALTGNPTAHHRFLAEVGGTVNGEAAEATGQTRYPVVGGERQCPAEPWVPAMVLPGRGMVSIGTSSDPAHSGWNPSWSPRVRCTCSTAACRGEFYMMGVTSSRSSPLSWLRP